MKFTYHDIKFIVINIYIHIIIFLLKFKKINDGYYRVLIVTITFLNFVLIYDLYNSMNR